MVLSLPPYIDIIKSFDSMRKIDFFFFGFYFNTQYKRFHQFTTVFGVKKKTVFGFITRAPCFRFRLLFNFVHTPNVGYNLFGNILSLWIWTSCQQTVLKSVTYGQNRFFYNSLSNDNCHATFVFRRALVIFYVFFLLYKSLIHHCLNDIRLSFVRLAKTTRLWPR